MSERKIKLLIQAAVSIGAFGAGLYILLTIDWSTNPEMVAAATGWIGLVLGYWLR